MSRKNKFIDLMEVQAELQEREEGKPRRIRFREAMTADVVNGNGRRYGAPVLEAAVQELRTHLNESAGQGRIAQVLGEAEHPSDKPTGRPNLLETVVKWDEVSFDGKHIDIIGRVLETSKGQDFLKLMEGGVMPGVSMRGYGEGKNVKTPEGDKVFEVTELHITGFDPVLNPSFENVAEWTESQNQNDAEAPEEQKMSDELLEKLQKQEQEKAELQKKLEEAQKSVAEAEKVKAELEESKRAAEVAKAVEEVIQSLPFGDKLNKMFVESVKGTTFNSVDEVKAFAESKRKEYGRLAAEGVLAGMGWDEKKNSIVVIGDVLESETGTPEFGRASFEIAESLHRAEMTEARNWNKPVSLNEKFTKMLLDRFDQLHQHKLMAESRMFQEASTTSDLNLPYSYSRALIEEAFPNLVAAGIFDVGIMNNSPERLFFETFAGETGYAGTATDEVVTGGAEDTWYALDYGRVTPGSVVVTSNPAGTIYVEGTDYVIDYAAGRIKFLTAGSINTNDVLVDYTYTAVRKGEMAVIERGKLTMSYMDISAAADRLADQISREAIVFSRSQLGLDIVARTMGNLVKQLRRKIDQGLIYAAYSAVKSVASNSGGTWTIGTTQDDYTELVRLIGATKLKVYNRYYEPTFILASATRAEDLSNWDGFKRDGFPNAVMTAFGFAGGVKGLPIFTSTEMPDDTIIVGNRQLVMHRVFQPMLINGPYPTYDVSGGTSKLLAADQYYAEEFNNTESPVEEKGAFLSVAEAGS